MPTLPDSSIDMVLCDLPYGISRNDWDRCLDLSALWDQYMRIVKPAGAIILFGQGIFSAQLIMSNTSMYRYSLVWDKVMTTGFLNANRMPLRSHEDIHVFYRKLPTYHPQMTPGKPSHGKGKAVGEKADSISRNRNYGNYTLKPVSSCMKYPTSILRYERPHPSKVIHSTQKPVELCKFLVQSYTNPGDMVMDNCMGSGTSGVAALQLGRRFTGIELDEACFVQARRRLHDCISRDLAPDVANMNDGEK